jgi:hypothetical protein
VAVDQQAQGFFFGARPEVEIEEQFGAPDPGRGDVEDDARPFVPSQFFADTALDPHFVGQVQGRGELDCGPGLGVDEAVAGVAAKIFGGDAAHGLLLNE